MWTEKEEWGSVRPTSTSHSSPPPNVICHVRGFLPEGPLLLSRSPRATHPSSILGLTSKQSAGVEAPLDCRSSGGLHAINGRSP